MKFKTSACATKSVLHPKFWAVIGITLGVLILGLFIPITQGLATSSTTIGGTNSDNYQNSDQFLRTYYNSLREQLGKVWEPKKAPPTLEIDLFGYKLTTTDVIPVTRDEEAKLCLYKTNSDTVDVQIITAFGTFCYSRIHIKEVVTLENQPRDRIRYELYDSAFGFFLELTIYAQYSRVNMAFADDCGQLTYDGVYSQGYLSSTHPFLSTDGKSQYTDQDSPPEQVNLENFITTLKTQQKDNLVINNDKLIANLNEEIIPKTRIFNYGVYHEAEDFSGTTYFDNLPWLWQEYTCIDTGIVRHYPVTKSQILSDLQYYNTDTDIYGGLCTQRNIMAYSIGCHGHFVDWYIEAWIWDDSQVFITAIEIAALWYTNTNPSYTVEVYPTNCLVIPDCCYGFYDDRTIPEDQYPDMAHAFVDYGAKVFIGSTIEIPIATDPWMTPFWWELCYYDQTTEHATIELCNAHGDGWNLGDEWMILGDYLYKLPN